MVLGCACLNTLRLRILICSLLKYLLFLFLPFDVPLQAIFIIDGAFAQCSYLPLEHRNLASGTRDDTGNTAELRVNNA